MENTLVQSAKDYAFAMHKNRYGKHPYSHHLNMVVDELLEVIECIDKEKQPILIAAAYLHDVVEDCPETNISIIEDRFGKKVSDIVCALTNHTSKRVSAEYYEKIAENPLAQIIKLCDRIANVSYCLNQLNPNEDIDKESRLLSLQKIKMYQRENIDFIEGAAKLRINDPEPFIKTIQKLVLKLVHLFNMFELQQDEKGPIESETTKSEKPSRTLLIQIKIDKSGTEFGFTGADLFDNHEIIGLIENAKLAYVLPKSKLYISNNPTTTNNEQPGTN